MCATVAHVVLRRPFVCLGERYRRNRMLGQLTSCAVRSIEEQTIVTVSHLIMRRSCLDVEGWCLARRPDDWAHFAWSYRPTASGDG